MNKFSNLIFLNGSGRIKCRSYYFQQYDKYKRIYMETHFVSNVALDYIFYSSIPHLESKWFKFSIHFISKFPDKNITVSLLSIQSSSMYYIYRLSI